MISDHGGNRRVLEIVVDGLDILVTFKERVVEG